ncbi:conserved hypothetical protein [Ricinus communis]|uniref:Uncharacterized protein n=1 Tax=Ricinus communis TaxID=3988 RepID=B9SIS7_RICCO|nr:conserved hypothetical protein [Ricinus communis]
MQRKKSKGQTSANPIDHNNIVEEILLRVMLLRAFIKMRILGNNIKQHDDIRQNMEDDGNIDPIVYQSYSTKASSKNPKHMFNLSDLEVEMALEFAFQNSSNATAPHMKSIYDLLGEVPGLGLLN